LNIQDDDLEFLRGISPSRQEKRKKFFFCLVLFLRITVQWKSERQIFEKKSGLSSDQ
jgi:hypothetical protein